MKPYPVAEIFRSLQGEGRWMGLPTTFVRLAGCSVKTCHIRAECDTDYKARESLSAADIVERVRALCPQGVVSITGGEPTDHDLAALADGLGAAGYSVHLETSGVRVVGVQIDWLTVSPKTPTYVQKVGHALKVVVRPGWTWEHIDALDDGTFFAARYLQPLTGADGAPINLPHVMELLQSPANARGRFGLSFQAHKVWGVR